MGRHIAAPRLLLTGCVQVLAHIAASQCAGATFASFSLQWDILGTFFHDFWDSGAIALPLSAATDSTFNQISCLVNTVLPTLTTSFQQSSLLLVFLTGKSAQIHPVITVFDYFHYFDYWAWILFPMHLYCSLQQIQQLRSSFVPQPSHVAYTPMKAMLSCPGLQGLFRVSLFLLICSHSSSHHKACFFSLLSSYKACFFFLPCPLCKECPASSNHLFFFFFYD